MKILGIEFGSTRIKLVLIDETNQIISSGSFLWENKLKNNKIWTYDLKDAINGLRAAYKDLKENFEAKFGKVLSQIDSIGVSGMMHGYLVFDKDFNQLAEFRTWRNTITSEASEILTREFDFPVPQRWSVAHIYQAVLNNEPEVKQIAHATTLAGYIHYLLSNEFCLGVGEASGVFPININTKTYDPIMVEKFNNLVSKKVPFRIEDVLPKVLSAGDQAGKLTKEGAFLLDPTGDLVPGSIMVPPEGDMGTGMVATNSVRLHTGNASLGTSSNVTLVTGKKIKVSNEIDQVLTPDGVYAALVHVNNGTSEINSCEKLFKDFLVNMGIDVSDNKIYEILFKASLDKTCEVKDFVSVDYLSGEPITHLEEGRPLLIKRNGSEFKLSNYMRMHIYSLFATICIGLNQLKKDENIEIEHIVGHGGFFTTKGVGDILFASALNCNIHTFESAGEGGPFGMALLAKYSLEKSCSLPDYLDKVFSKFGFVVAKPDDFYKNEFEEYLDLYKKAIEVEKCALKHI